jgi:hypothetical protein
MPRGTWFVREDMMDKRHQEWGSRITILAFEPSVDKKKRRMTEFILNEDVEPAGLQAAAETWGKTKPQPFKIRAERKADYFHLVAKPYQFFDHHPVVKITTAEGVQAAVNDETDMHQGLVR